LLTLKIRHVIGERRTRHIIMTDQTAEAARLMKVTEAVVEELARQGVLEIMADEGFDPVEMARAVIKAADGDVVPLKRAPT
jgi:predicted transcriptional regulator